MKNKINCFVIAIIAFIFIFTGCSNNNGNMKKIKEAAIEPKNMDTKINPGENFYMYTNGGWIKNNPVPDEYSRYSAFDVLQEKNDDKLKEIFEESEKDSNAGKNSNNSKIGNFYASGIDSVKIDKEGISPLSEELDLIDAIKTKEDLQKEIAHLHTMDINPLFVIYAAQDEKNSEMIIAQLYQGGLGLPDRDYYICDDSRSIEIRESYKKHLIKMFELQNIDRLSELNGNSQSFAERAANEVIKIETKLANASWTRIELRDPDKGYNKFSIEELKKKYNVFNWKEYFNEIGLSNQGDINIGQPSFFKELDKIIKETNLESWKIYLRWNLINSTATYLSSDFEKQNFDFYSAALSGKTKMQPRWKRVINAVNEQIGEAVGPVYVQKFFSEEAKVSMIKLVNNLKISLKERIQNLVWMGKETKLQAVAKLEAMNIKIGYPDKWRDYSKLTITKDSYIQNVLAARKFNFEFMLSKIGKPVDKLEWHMTPQTVNAYYSPNANEIVFPAAILQPPFFNKDADDAVNYGAIGAVIGHEMTHGFDDQGCKYDKDGNLKNWWSNEDSENFAKNTKVIIDQYNSFKILDTLHIDGDLTLGENIADIGGVTLALNALKNALKSSNDTSLIDGFTPLQRFFISYSQVWRMSIRDKELMRRIKEDVHSPGIARVNGVMSNIPEYYEVFNINEKDALFLAPDKRAKIW